MLLGIDQILDMGRTAVNVMGNCMATAVVARWEGVLDDDAMRSRRHEGRGRWAPAASSARDGRATGPPEHDVTPLTRREVDLTDSAGGRGARSMAAAPGADRQLRRLQQRRRRRGRRR